MRDRARGLIMESVINGTGTVELVVRISVGEDPIRGTAVEPGHEPNEFWGWLELAEIVDRVAKQRVAPGPQLAAE